MSAPRISKGLVPASRKANFPWDSMEAGDSFHVSLKDSLVNATRVRSSYASFIRRTGSKLVLVIRKSATGYRCWLMNRTNERMGAR